MANKITVSVMCSDLMNLERDIKALERNGVDWLHIDIMDGVFVPNISFGFPVLEHVARICNKPLDVHLMIVQPEKFIPEVKALGAMMMNVHYLKKSKNLKINKSQQKLIPSKINSITIF